MSTEVSRTPNVIQRVILVECYGFFNDRLYNRYVGHNFYTLQLVNLFRPFSFFGETDRSYTICIYAGWVENVWLNEYGGSHWDCITRTRAGENFVCNMIEQNNKLKR